MIVFPNAKINLGLRILNKRSDGFHEIESLFVPIGLSDILEVVPSLGSDIHIEITGMELDSPPDQNLVAKAWQLMQLNHSIPPVKIHLHKIIPVGAGLGGGSSDAAFMLVALNTLFSCNCTTEMLEAYAAEIGSDCAFFIRNRPAIGTGRGELLLPYEIDFGDLEILLVNPGLHISSGEAYSGVIPNQPAHQLKDLLKSPPDNWNGSVENAFELSVFNKYPEIKELKETLLKAGAVYASMTGSGSSVYGFFKPGILDRRMPDFGNWFYYRDRLGKVYR